MPEVIRSLNESGIAAFRAYLGQCREGSSNLVPTALLRQESTSIALPADLAIELRSFENRFDFGQYLVNVLEAADRRAISRQAGLWTWLALFYFDLLCPLRGDGTRKVLSDEAYILPARYDFRSYYRHLVRMPWLAASEHGEFSKVLLIPAGTTEGAPLSTRGEIIEQMASRQAVLMNRRVIEAVYRIYFNKGTGRPSRGTAGSGGGSPRRLAVVLQQLDLTFDLAACAPETIVELLPSEFERWKRRAA